MAHFLTQPITAEIASHALEPSLKSVRITQLPDTRESLDQHLLGHILRIMHIAQGSQTQTIDLLRVATNECRIGLSVPPLTPNHQLCNGNVRQNALPDSQSPVNGPRLTLAK